jgi:hypothetical protein
MVMPVQLVQRAIRQHRWMVLAIGVVLASFTLWWHSEETIIGFCTGTAYPEDIADTKARSRLTDAQSNYWAAFNGNSEEDMLAARQDFFVALAQARNGDCVSLADVNRLGSLRTQWMFGLGSIPALMFALIAWLLILHGLMHIRIERELAEGLAVIAAALSLYPVLAYYADWYISFGDTVIERPVATILGIMFSSLTLFVLPLKTPQCPLWQRLAQSLATFGLLANLLSVVWSRSFVHIAQHFAALSLAVVLFIELLLAAWVVATVILFATSLDKPQGGQQRSSSAGVMRR